ncbi:MAG: hypothetical protein Q9157_008848 [Trypethelium eluteriae]
MSSDVPGGGGDRPGRRARIGNLVKRFRTVFRRKNRPTSDDAQLGEGSTTATNAPAAATPATATTAAAPGATAAQKDEPSTSSKPAQPAAGGVPSIDIDPIGEEPKIALPHTRNVAQRDRVQHLFTKYGIEIDPEDIVTTRPQEFPERVHKPIRGKKDNQDPPGAAAVRRSKKEDINDRKPIRPPVDRYCHRCDTHFDPPNQSACATCGHKRCTRCIPEPPKSKRWPDAYAPEELNEGLSRPVPADRVYRRAKVRVKVYCDRCGGCISTTADTCQCGHKRCNSCTRVPPKQLRQSVDPEILRAVEAKLAQFSLGGSLSSHAAVAVTVS